MVQLDGTVANQKSLCEIELQEKVATGFLLFFFLPITVTLLKDKCSMVLVSVCL